MSQQFKDVMLRRPSTHRSTFIVICECEPSRHQDGNIYSIYARYGLVKLQDLLRQNTRRSCKKRVCSFENAG